MNSRSAVLLALATAACPLLPTSAQAQGRPMRPLSDAELSQTWGQALLDLTNTTQGGYNFSRLTLNANIDLSMNLGGLKLGTYTYAPRNGTGSDIDISALQFGRSDLAASANANTVAITNPYFEWVYSNPGTTSSQVVGMRLGLGSIAGNVGLQMNVVSGSLLITDANGNPIINSANDTALNGKRWDGLAGCSTCTVPLSQIGGVLAGNASGPSRDFFLSILKTALTWPTANAALPAQAQAQSGFWLNWTDRLAALNTTGTMPPNVAKIGP